MEKLTELEKNTSFAVGGERARIPVWLLEQARRLGTSESALLEAYPSLRAEDLANASAYVRSHPLEIEDQIRANEAAR